MIYRTRWASYSLGKIPKGCELCVQGKKLVVFITGKCTRHCFYCPLSEKRAGIDKVWVNERVLSSNLALKEAIEEAKASCAKGAGITGGDPLLFVQRTCKFVKALKRAFGKAFHVHIYLPTKLVTRKRLSLLADSVDEVRFHPDFLNLNSEEIEKIKLARDFKWKIGMEIPVLPDKIKETKKLIELTARWLDFLNLNELELSDTNLEAMLARGYKPKADGYCVKGSQEAALKILKWLNKRLPDLNPKLQVHYCTARTKNAFQYKNRLKRRAKRTKAEWDLLTKACTFYRGALYLPWLKPGAGYETKLEKLDKKTKLKALKELKQKKIKLGKFIQSKLIGIDKFRLRILCPAPFAKEFAKEIKALNLEPALVEELPTYTSELLQLEWL